VALITARPATTGCVAVEGDLDTGGSADVVPLRDDHVVAGKPVLVEQAREWSGRGAGGRVFHDSSDWVEEPGVRGRAGLDRVECVQVAALAAGAEQQRPQGCSIRRYRVDRGAVTHTHHQMRGTGVNHLGSG